MQSSKVTVEELRERGVGRLPGLIGIEILSIGKGTLGSKLELRDELLAPNGYLHAATVIALADTSCGYACVCNLPTGANSFTTIELKANFSGTARSGSISCLATLQHSGRTTQIWDAVVTNDEDKRTIALFRCTQMILYPKP